MWFFKKKSKNTQAERPAFPADGPTWARSLPGEIYKIWPKKNGEAEPPAFLQHCSTINMEDELLINMLTGYGIPSIRLYPQNGSFGKVVLGMSADGADIYVPESMLDEAISLSGGLTND